LSNGVSDIEAVVRLVNHFNSRMAVIESGFALDVVEDGSVVAICLDTCCIGLVHGSWAEIREKIAPVVGFMLYDQPLLNPDDDLPGFDIWDRFTANTFAVYIHAAAISSEIARGGVWKQRQEAYEGLPIIERDV